MKKGAKLYLQQNVLEAAQERISLLFDRFEQIEVAVSGGKDSVDENSTIYVRIDGHIRKTTPAKLLELMTIAKEWRGENGQIYMQPKETVEILTASSTIQKEAKSAFAPITYIMHHLVEEGLYDIETRQHRHVLVTGDHSVMRAYSGSGWKVAQAAAVRDLIPGDRVFAVNDLGFEGDKVDLPDWLLRVAGLWIADGCYALDRKMVISTGNFAPVVEFLQNIPRPPSKTEIAAALYASVRSSHTHQEAAIRAVVKELGVTRACVANGIYRGVPAYDKTLHCWLKANGDVWLCNKTLVERLQSLGFTGTSRTKSLPDWLYTASRRQIGLFLAGYFDGDGTVKENEISCASVNESLLQGIRELLWRLGIPHGWNVQQVAHNGFTKQPYTFYRISVGSAIGIRNFQRWIPTFKSTANCAIVDNGVDYAFSGLTIKRITRLPDMPRRVFDFEVADNHMFVANSLLLHNSTVLEDLCRKEALRRGRVIRVFFLDQEAEYQSTIEQIRYLMTLEGVIPYWYQVPLRMTNATSLQVDFLYAWGPGEPWMREKDELSIHTIEEDYPQRFYPLIAWREKQWEQGQACSVVGLRAEESLNRFRTMVKHPGLYNGDKPLTWTSAGHTPKAYPLYDWTFEDVWHYIAEQGLRYNRVYDFMHLHGHRIQEVRVSYLGHENSFKCLPDLHEFEPETYRRLLERMPGMHVAARYANESMMYQAKKLPPGFGSWRAYRDFLLETTPSLHVERFRERFAKQGNDEEICRQQCRQLLINDWEQNIAVIKPKQKKEDTLARWRGIL